jgi:hypothetical protein
VDHFLARFASLVTCTLAGFDRLVFRGTLLPLVQRGGMFAFLCRSGVRLLDFKTFVLETSERVARRISPRRHRDHGEKSKNLRALRASVVDPLGCGRRPRYAFKAVAPPTRASAASGCDRGSVSTSTSTGGTPASAS